VPPRVDPSKYSTFSTTFQITLLYHLQLFIRTETYRPSDFCLQSGHVACATMLVHFLRAKLASNIIAHMGAVPCKHLCALSDSRQNHFYLLTQNCRACRHLNLYSYVRVPTCLYLCIMSQITLRHCPPLQYRTSVSTLAFFTHENSGFVCNHP